MKRKFLTSLLLAATVLPSHALTTISFLTDTWRYDLPGTTTGLVSQTAPLAASQTRGYVDKDGITLTFTATFVGNAISGANTTATTGSSMTNNPTGTNPPGFVLSAQNNDSPGLTEGISAPLAIGAVTSYQRWHFEFSQPVTLNTFLMEDIDNLSGDFRDILGAEGFTSVTPGITPTAGTGFNPTFGFFNAPVATNLTSGSLTVLGQDLSVAYPIVNTGNPASVPRVNASVSFGSTPISAFSIYAISNTNFVHRMALDGSSFVIVVPEPSTSALGIVALGCALLRRRR